MSVENPDFYFDPSLPFVYETPEVRIIEPYDFGRVWDYREAQDRAKVEDGLRDRVTANEALEETDLDLKFSEQDLWEEHTDQPTLRQPVAHLLAEWKHRKARRDLDRRYADYDFDKRTEDNYAEKLLDIDSSFLDFLDRAVVYRKMIDSATGWAGILYHHPVGQAYREAHPGIEFTALGLAKLEQTLSRMKRGDVHRDEDEASVTIYGAILKDVYLGRTDDVL